LGTIIHHPMTSSKNVCGSGDYLPVTLQPGQNILLQLVDILSWLVLFNNIRNNPFRPLPQRLPKR
jgi:hypothetical protein